MSEEYSLYEVGSGLSGNTTKDFYGFSFNGHHSADMHFVRVSNGNRYTENLIPTFQDKTVAVPGGDGTYFFDSFYTQRQFTLDIAFDSMTETDLRKLRQVFNTREAGDLIFDETPYKKYHVKVQSPPQIKYICFDKEAENNSRIQTTRIYKGEGTIQFISYYPFARSVHKFLDEFNSNTEARYGNKDEWAESTGMLKNNNNYYDTPSTKIYIYNPGDVETDFMAYYNITNLSSPPSNMLEVKIKEDRVLRINKITEAKSTSDSYVRINSKTNLLEGCDSSYKPTGTLYNDYVVSGDFFKIPVTTATDVYLSSSVSCSKIEYDYLYY